MENSVSDMLILRSCLETQGEMLDSKFCAELTGEGVTEDRGHQHLQRRPTELSATKMACSRSVQNGSH